MTRTSKQRHRPAEYRREVRAGRRIPRLSRLVHAFRCLGAGKALAGACDTFIPVTIKKRKIGIKVLLYI